MRPFGFSTGALARADFARALVMMKEDLSLSVLELSALREPELEPLVLAFDVLDLRRFSYVAIHAPSVMDDEQRVVKLLDGVAVRGLPIVVHPDAIRDWSLWRHFGALLCIENMDKRKPMGRSRNELGRCFDLLPQAGLCLDLGHARQIDPTMTEAELILRAFGDRLKQIHLSEVDTQSKHDRLSYTTACACRRVAALIPEMTPIVLETPVREEEMALEIRRANWALERGGVPSSSDRAPILKRSA
jgi:hypothetical protein